MAIKERINEFIKSKGISTTSFEKRCGFSKGFVKNIVNTISVDKMGNILAAYPEINPGWLMTGTGNMILSDENPRAVIDELMRFVDRRAMNSAQFFAGNQLAVGNLSLNEPKKVEEIEKVEEVNTSTDTECANRMEKEIERLNREIKGLNAEIKRLNDTLKAKDETIKTQKQLIKHLDK